MVLVPDPVTCELVISIISKIEPSLLLKIVKLPELTVIASLKLKVSVESTATFVASSLGVVLEILGRARVWKFQVV